MPELVPEPGLTAWRNFLGAHAAVIRRIESDLRRRRLVRLDWYDVLIAIAGAGGRRVRMSELASRLMLTRSGATRLADRLQKAGLIRREVAPEDGRGACAVLTPAGWGALRSVWPVYADGINALFLAHLSEEEAAIIGRALARIRSAAEGPASEHTRAGGRGSGRGC